MTEAVVDQGAIYRLAMAFAASSAFQEVTGTTNQTDAFEHVHYPEVTAEWVENEVTGEEELCLSYEQRPPRITISDELGELSSSEGGFGPSGTRMQQTLMCLFDFYVPDDVASVSVRNQWTWFSNNVIAIIKEAGNLGRQDIADDYPYTYDIISDWDRFHGPYKIDSAERATNIQMDHPDEGFPPYFWHVGYMLRVGY